jgi:endogenous inhibitor of DNA gyrase (YacG/DUF329 family)
MATPYRYDIEDSCSGCGKLAIVGIAENDYAFARKRGMRIDEIKQGDFTAKMTGEVAFTVHCNSCGADTRWVETPVTIQLPR